MVSDTVSPGRTAGNQTGSAAAGDAHGGRRAGRRRLPIVVTAAVLVAAAAVAAVWAAGGFNAAPDTSPAGNGYATTTAPVVRESLTSQSNVNATLGYSGSYKVTGKGSGTLTWLPRVGRVIRDGQVLYRVDNAVPVVLLYGSVPAWRALSVGDIGQDVSQLNHDLVNLGYADSGYIAELGWDYYGWETQYAVQQLQTAVGMVSSAGTATGELSLGSAVFLPGAQRVTVLSPSLGGPATGTIYATTSARRVVTINLNADQQTEVKAGNRVSVTLPDGTSTPGVISSVGKVASGSGSSATVTVDVTLRHPKAAGRLDEAPVTVSITSGSVRAALAVPVAALQATPRGYVVEVVGSHGHHLVKVTPGLFDDAAGMVAVTGPGLAAGQRVVVPAL
jgi:peptidoglycan hydrolase-like protein with peptidoglycan-binding domain